MKCIKEVNCIISKQKVNGEMEDLDPIFETSTVLDIFHIMKEYKFHVIVNQDIGTDISDNPVHVLYNKTGFLLSLVETQDLNPATQTLRIYCFLDHNSLFDFLNIILN